MSTLCSGATVMLAGYIKGGAAAFPITASLFATTLAAVFVTRHAGRPRDCGWPPIVGVGVIGLFGLVFVGRFFGAVSTGRSLAILLAPLLCWVTECPGLRIAKPWCVGSLRTVLVAIPLVVVLILAKRDFDRDMAPLLVHQIHALAQDPCDAHTMAAHTTAAHTTGSDSVRHPQNKDIPRAPAFAAWEFDQASVPRTPPSMRIKTTQARQQSLTGF